MEKPLYTEWKKLMESENVISRYSEFCFVELIDAYSDPLRFYHNLDHLHHLFSLYRDYINHLTDPVITGLSIFYHDIVYKPERKDNEEESAGLAAKRLIELQLPVNRIERIVQFIRATSNHRLPEDRHAQDLPIFLDMDMSILASPDAKYKQYLWNLRKEYGLFSIEIFIQKRRSWIKELLQQKIYLSKLFEQMEEAAARNLNWELRNGAEWLKELEEKAS